jgi:hypothetical protein
MRDLGTLPPDEADEILVRRMTYPTSPWIKEYGNDEVCAEQGSPGPIPLEDEQVPDAVAFPYLGMGGVAPSDPFVRASTRDGYSRL